MAITVHQIPKPVIELSLDTGGDLPDATTYYFTGYFCYQGGYYGNLNSPIADEVSITTTAANQRILMKWKYWDTGLEEYVYGPPTIAGKGFYFQFKWDNYTMLDGGSKHYRWCNVNDPAIDDEFDQPYGHYKWSHLYHEPGWGATQIYITSSYLKEYPTDGLYYSNGRNNPECAWAFNQFPYDGYTIDWTLGSLLIEVTGTGNDDEDVYNALKNSGFTDQFMLYGYDLDPDGNYRAKHLVLYGNFFASGSVELIITRMNIHFLGSSCLSDYITFNKCNILVSGFSTIFWQNCYGIFVESRLNHMGNALILNHMDTLPVQSAFWCSSTATIYAYASGSDMDGYIMQDMTGCQFRYYVEPHVIKNSTFDNCYLLATPTGGEGEEYTGIWENLIFINHPAYDIRFDMNSSSGLDVVHDITIRGCYSDNEDGKLRIQWVNIGTPNSIDFIVKVTQTMRFKITDDNGDNLVGATIKITNGLGEVFQDVTDENGELTLYPVTYSIEFDEGDTDGYGYYSKTTEKNPLDILIWKDGYDDYNRKEVTVIESQSWDISLKATTIEEIGEGFTIAHQSQSMRHLFINEDIPKIGDTAGLLASASDGSVYMALFTANPGEYGSITNEAAYSGYGRVAVARGSGSWHEYMGKVRNLLQVNFPECMGDPETITHYAVMKEGAGDEMICYGELDEPMEVIESYQPQFGPYSLQFKLN